MKQATFLIKSKKLFHVFYAKSHARRFQSTNGLSYYHKPGKMPLLYRTIGQQLELSAKAYPNTVALASMYENKAITYPEVLDKADKFAAGLANLGIKQGDRIGIWMPNKLNWYIALMGIARMGGIAVTLNPAFQVNEIDFCIRKVGIKAMIITETCKTQNYFQNYYKTLLNLFPELQSGSSRIKTKHSPMERVILDSDKRLSGTIKFEDLLCTSTGDASAIRDIQDQIQVDEGCNIQFTSGSTGKPKAALLSHFNIINSARNIGLCLEFDKDPHNICLSIPFFHCFGLIDGFVSALMHGVSCSLPSSSFEAKETIKCIQKYGCTYMYGTPVMYYDVISYLKNTQTKLTSLQYSVTGGALITPTLLRDMEQCLGTKSVLSSYGMTEGASVSFTSVHGEPKERKLKFVGKAVDNLEVKVVDPKGNLVPYGQPGELWTRGYSTMLGYYGDEKKTRETLSPGGWLKTGDQFVLHEDGYGQIIGRIKEMINRGGENIFPKEIEEFLSTHPDIEEVVVAGVPDERLGEEVAAFIKLVPKGSNLTQEDVNQFCRGKIAYFKIPRYVTIVDSFPRTASQKIQKFKLVEDFIAQK